MSSPRHSFTRFTNIISNYNTLVTNIIDTTETSRLKLKIKLKINLNLTT